MALTHSQIVPTAFWVGFLVLGLITSSSGPEKRHSAQATRSVKAAKSSTAPIGAVAAETTALDARDAKPLKEAELAD